MPYSNLTLFSLCIAAAFACGCQSESGDPAKSATTSVSGEVAGIPAEEQTAPKSGSKAGDSTSTEASSSTFEYVAPQLTEQDLREGWISLFDGTSLFGWETPDGTNWRIENNTIVADEGEVSLLRTPFSFDDFELRCDFHLAQGGNSGVFLRTAEGSSDPAKDTYELNICDNHDAFKTGSLVARHAAENVPAVEGEWHTFHIVCSGPNIKVSLDGKPIVDFTDESESQRSTGQIGLQHNSGRVAFRNVFLKPLNTKELFNGEDLTGWRDVPGTKSEFKVVDGAIHAESGPGFLETVDTFDNFILHVEANINDAKAIEDGRPANSGVFFRAKPGSEEAPSHGYEMQIQHDFKDGDRSQPADFGSGGIYRREPARYVPANNNEWFVETLIAQGNRFATFVNGYQVLDWTDTRDPDENPRKGLRLKAGHLSLQGHDPTTDLDFRSLRIHELQ